MPTHNPDTSEPKPAAETQSLRYPKAPPTIPLGQRQNKAQQKPVVPAQHKPVPPAQLPPSQPVVRPEPPRAASIHPLTPPPGGGAYTNAQRQYQQSNRPVFDEDTQPIPIVRPDRVRIPAQNTGTPPSPPKPPKKQKPRYQWSSIFLSLTLMGVGLFFLALVALAFGYIYLAAQLPSPEELRARQPNFASSQIFDRNGKLLHEIIDPNAGKRTYVPINQISRYLQLATVATEDRNFYTHGGFDPIAIGRAIFYALQEKEIVSGASTITQQVARNILLGPEAALDISASRKIKEIISGGGVDPPVQQRRDSGNLPQQ